MRSLKALAMTAVLILAAATSGTFAQGDSSGSPPPASTGQPIPPDQLDSLLAPIALYPDALVVQILTCASSPYQVNQVNDWLGQQDLKGTALQQAAQEQGFDASFIGIVLFPQVVQQMATDMDWTRQLGQAFTTDRDGVLASVQRLRLEAQSVGNLETTPQQNVQTVTADNGQQIIVIQPANPQVVYVPQYDPQVVYTTTTTQDNSGQVATAALIGFAAGVIVGAVADNDDDHYYYSCGGWGYARPICYPGGYDNYYHHRENMANDYYDHRQDMARQRGDNQGNRQQSRGDAQGNRQDTRSQGQSNRSDARSQGQSNRSDAQGDRQSNRSANQSGRQDARAPRGTTSSRGASQNGVRGSQQRSGTSSGAFSGYQRGSTERASSARGRSSMSGGSRSSGGRSSGGGRRR